MFFIVGITFTEDDCQKPRILRVTANDPAMDPLGLHGREFECWPNTAFIMMYKQFQRFYKHEVVGCTNGFMETFEVKATLVFQK